MDRRSGDNGPPSDDEFGWEEETVEVRSVEPPAPPPVAEHTRRTLASDLRRLRKHRSFPVLAAVAALVIVTTVVVVLVTRDDGETSTAAEVAPPTTTAAESTTATQQDSTEPVTTATSGAPAISVSEAETLRLGDQGATVRTLQRALAQLGLFADEPDGIYGEQTQAAVQAFQESAGLTIDGTVGPQTALALNQALTRAG